MSPQTDPEYMTADQALARPDMPATAPQQAEPTRIVTLADFEVAPTFSGDREAWARRFSTLFLTSAGWRRGGMGKVSYARNLAHESVALKVLIAPERHELEDDDAYARRMDNAVAAFRTEYQNQLALSGTRGFPRLYGYGLVDGMPAMVMEWIEGVTLAQARDQLALSDAGRLSPLTVARLGRDLFALLVRLGQTHGGLVHRDISLANVIVRTGHMGVAEQEREGAFDLCLIDFGSATSSDPGDASFTRARFAARAATAEYAPPEMLTEDLPQLAELRRSPSIDVYAAASVLYELLSGRTPFSLGEKNSGSGQQVSFYRTKMDQPLARPATLHDGEFDVNALPGLEPEVAVSVANALLDAPKELAPETIWRSLSCVDDQLVDVVCDCLAKRQKDRPSAEAVCAALDAFASNYPQNVARAFGGLPLIPCTATGEWYAAASPVALRRMLRSAGSSASLAIWLVVVISMGLLLGGRVAVASAFGLSRKIVFSVIETSLLLAAPTIAMRVVRRQTRGGLERFGWSSATLAVTTLLLVAGASTITFVDGGSTGAVFAGILAATSAAWCPVVLEYATEVMPAYMREATRKLPVGGARSSRPVLNGEMNADAD